MLKVLKSQTENREIRAEMRRQGIDCKSSLFQRLLHKFGFVKQVNIGDSHKNWDVLETVQFLKENVPLDSSILDIGAYASEILCILYKLNYKNLTGIDLNPKLSKMPYSDKIHYIIGDFMQTSFEDESFNAITAISVIEHGYKGQQLLTEVSQILKNEGYFIVSVYYWPEKIDTCDIKPFSMEWKIFSEDELRSFIKEAEKYGFKPCGAIDFNALEQTIKWNRRKYTFAWIALQKI